MSSGMLGGGVVPPSDSSSAGNSATDLIENTTPPLVLLSSRVKSSGVYDAVLCTCAGVSGRGFVAGLLAGCVNEGVVVVRYTYESTSLAKLLQLVHDKLKGRPALSIAWIMEGSQAAMKMCSQKALSDLSVREDSEVREFLRKLVGNYLYGESHYARLDLLLCPMANTLAGQQLLSKLKLLVGVPVFASADILKASTSEPEG